MRTFLFCAVVVGSIAFLQCCSGSKSATTTPAPAVATSFNQQVLPIIQASCANCHIAGKGNKKSLDNYANAVSEADDMIRRIQMNPGEHGFMPVRHDKLADSSIAVFVQWKKDGLKE